VAGGLTRQPGEWARDSDSSPPECGRVASDDPGWPGRVPAVEPPSPVAEHRLPHRHARSLARFGAGPRLQAAEILSFVDHRCAARPEYDWRARRTARANRKILASSSAPNLRVSSRGAVRRASRGVCIRPPDWLARSSDPSGAACVGRLLNRRLANLAAARSTRPKAPSFGEKLRRRFIRRRDPAWRPVRQQFAKSPVTLEHRYERGSRRGFRSKARRHLRELARPAR